MIGYTGGAQLDAKRSFATQRPSVEGGLGEVGGESETVNGTTAMAAESMGVTGAVLTHPGLVRDASTDFAACCDPLDAAGVLAIVADGQDHGLASRVAGETVRRVFYETEAAPPRALEAGFKAASKAVLEHAQSDPDCAGMSASCTAVAIRDGAAFLAHAGDSRAYILRDGALYQISEDHTLAAEMVRSGQMSRQEAATSPDRQVILKALGALCRFNPLIWAEGLPLRRGDVLVLCSDGLSDVVSDAAIAERVSHRTPEEACQALLDLALRAGAPDAISICVLAVGDLPPPRREEMPALEPMPPEEEGATMHEAAAPGTLRAFAFAGLCAALLLLGGLVLRNVFFLPTSSQGAPAGPLTHLAEARPAPDPAPPSAEPSTSSPPAPAAATEAEPGRTEVASLVPLRLAEPEPHPAGPARIRGDVAVHMADGWPVVQGQAVRLFGVEPLPANKVRGFLAWLSSQGLRLDCKLVAGDAYRCLTVGRVDIAQAMLLNGATRATRPSLSDAPPEAKTYLAAYASAEQRARAERRGLWR